MKPKAERTLPGNQHPTEDELAREHLGGPRGAKELEPAPMTPQREKKMPLGEKRNTGHTA